MAVPQHRFGELLHRLVATHQKQDAAPSDQRERGMDPAVMEEMVCHGRDPARADRAVSLWCDP